MGTTANGETVATTGTTTLGNTTGSPAVQQTGKLVKGAGAGASSAAKKNSNAKCTKEGHPVDVVTGEVVDEGLDLSTPGIFEVEWRRIYSSGFADESTPLGRGGWSFTLHQWVELGAKTVLRNDDGRNVDFDPVPDKGMVFHRGRRLEVTRRSDRIEVRSLITRLTRVFEPATPGGRALLREIHDSRGNRVELHYQGEMLTTVVDTAKREYRIQSDHAGRIVEVAVWARGKPQETVHYTYTATGELASVTNALGHTERYEYDGYHRLLHTTLKNGVGFHYQYDDLTGRCTKTWGDGGLYTVAIDYDDGAHVNITSGNPEPHRYTYDDRNAIVRQESIDGSVVWERDYDADLLVVAERNGAGEEIKYEYDARGNLLKRTDAAGNETVFEYADDLLVRRIDPGGLTMVYERNRFGDIEAVIQPSGWTTRASYDPQGRIVQVYTTDGELVRAEYDAAHNRINVRNWRGATTQYAYDAMGRSVGRVDPIGRRWGATYDAVGQVASVTYPDGTASFMGWDPLGYLVQQTNAKGETTRFEYAGLGALLRMTLPDGQFWAFTYDKNQRLVAAQNPKRELFEYRYDRAGRVAEERTFDGRVLHHTYNLANRLARTEQPDGSFLAFAYDPLGNVVEESTPDGVSTLTRDATGRVVETVVDELAGKTVVTYELDALGNLVKETQNGRVIEREYDPRGWCVSRKVEGVNTKFAYNSFGEYVGVDHDGHKVLVQRDVLGREIRRHHYDSQLDVLSQYGTKDELVRQRAATPSPTVAGGFRDLVTRRWDYDPLGQPTREEDARWGSSSYEYDAQGHLIAMTRPSGREVFDYDAADSLVRRLDALGQGGPTWTSGQGGVLARTGDTEFEYDDNHRRIAARPLAGGPGTEYLWDARGCLREVKKPDGERVRFFYDAFRRRLRKEIHAPLSKDGDLRASRAIDFVWDRSTLCAEIDSERGKRFFVFAPGTFIPLLQAEHGEVFACVTDYMGTPRELIDGAGQVAWAADHDAWGRVDRTTSDQASRHAGKVESPFRTQGQYWDEEIGLAYTWHRYFDPAVGRFLSPDPIELDGGGNLFSLNGAPTVTIDPTGLANPYDIGTYGSQNGGSNVGDGLDADELLLNGFIKARQSSLLPGNEFGGHGSGNASRDNPTIALPGRGLSGTHAAGHGGAHGQVWDAERAAGLHDPAKLATMTAKEVIETKAKILKKVLMKNGFSAEDADAKVEELKKAAIAHAKNIFPPCVHGY